MTVGCTGLFDQRGLLDLIQDFYAAHKDNRDGELFHHDSLTVNANRFAEALRGLISSYALDLEHSDWNSELSKNFRKKMRSILNNCQRSDR